MERDVWREVGDGILVRSYHEQLLNVGLVLGAERCLIIDTRSTSVQGQALRDAVREVTSLPWTVVNTHGHWDHAFGNARFVPTDIWAHRRCLEMLETDGPAQRERIAARALAAGEDDFARDMAAVTITLPTHTFDLDATLELGGREVHLRHLGRGHTDNDIVVRVPDAELVFAGDLLEEGDPPEFGDSFPLDWAGTLAHLLPLATGAVVPGHGEVVDHRFIIEQAATIDVAARQAREAHAEGRPLEDLVPELEFPERTARDLLTRAERQLVTAAAPPPPSAPAP